MNVLSNDPAHTEERYKEIEAGTDHILYSERHGEACNEFIASVHERQLL
jgi:hypothetical protein